MASSDNSKRVNDDSESAYFEYIFQLESKNQVVCLRTAQWIASADAAHTALPSWRYVGWWPCLRGAVVQRGAIVPPAWLKKVCLLLQTHQTRKAKRRFSHLAPSSSWVLISLAPFGSRHGDASAGDRHFLMPPVCCLIYRT